MARDGFPLFAERLRAYRERHGSPPISELARRWGIDGSVVSRWFRGETRPDGKNLLRLLAGCHGELSNGDVYADEIAAPAPAPAVEPAPVAE